MVRVCCFCDKIHDDAIGLWQERRGSVSGNSTGESAILSYTCCHHCLDADPRADVFRARERQSTASLYGIRANARSRHLTVS